MSRKWTTIELYRLKFGHWGITVLLTLLKITYHFGVIWRTFSKDTILTHRYPLWQSTPKISPEIFEMKIGKKSKKDWRTEPLQIYWKRMILEWIPFTILLLRYVTMHRYNIWHFEPQLYKVILRSLGSFGTFKYIMFKMVLLQS